MKREFLKIENGVKQVDGKPRLFSIYLNVIQNKVNGIIASRRSEMSTLFNILSGRDRFSGGSVYYHDTLINKTGNTFFLRDHVAIINEESHLVDSLSIAENIFIVRDMGSKIFTNIGMLQTKARLFLERFDVHISVERPVRSLSNIERCQVELLKAFINNTDLVLLDFRLNHLTDTDFELFFSLVNHLKNNGMTFLGFGYAPKTILHFSDTLAVISDGKTAGIYEHDECDEDVIYRLLLGRLACPSSPAADLYSNEPAALSLRGVTSEYIENASLSLRKKQVVYLFYSDEYSGRELQDILCGLVHPKHGQILVDGKCCRLRDTTHAIRCGIVTISPESGLFPNMSVFDNFALGKGAELKAVWWNERFRKNLRGYLTELIGRDVSRCSINELTEEERYRLICYRWLLYRPSVAVFINPFSNVDVQMSQQTNKLIRAFADQGSGVLLIMQNNLFTDTIDAPVYVLENKSIKRV